MEQQNIRKIFLRPYKDGKIAYGVFYNKNQQPGPDFGRKVKHVIYQDDEQPNVWWHERIFLAHTKYHAPTYCLWISKRKFFGKVRLVKERDGCLLETWQAVAATIAEIDRKNRIVDALRLREEKNKK